MRSLLGVAKKNRTGRKIGSGKNTRLNRVNFFLVSFVGSYFEPQFLQILKKLAPEGK